MKDLWNLFVLAGIRWKGLGFRSLLTVSLSRRSGSMVVENCGAGKDLSVKKTSL